jgi:thioesterase domain-containing protein/acyl carrier protein
VSVARPAGELEHQLIAAFSRILGRVDLTRDDDFFDAGGDSLAAVELWVAIEEDFGVRVALSDFATTCTPSHLAAVLTRGEGKPDLGSRVHATKPAVYCVHLRPAWIGHWLVLASQLVEFRVEGVLSQPLDRGSVEVTTIEAMARGGVDRLLASRPPSQFVLCGHSMGGAVAVEMSRLLGEMGQPPACVVLLDPTRPFKHRQSVRAARFAKLSTRRKALALARQAKRVFRPARADPLWAIYASYRPSPINGRLIVVEASDTVTVWGSSVDWWTRHLGRSLETLSVDGDHVTMVSNPRVAELIASIPLD